MNNNEDQYILNKVYSFVFGYLDPYMLPNHEEGMHKIFNGHAYIKELEELQISLNLQLPPSLTPVYKTESQTGQYSVLASSTDHGMSLA